MKETETDAQVSQTLEKRWAEEARCEKCGSFGCNNFFLEPNE